VYELARLESSELSSYGAINFRALENNQELQSICLSEVKTQISWKSLVSEERQYTLVLCNASSGDLPRRRRRIEACQEGHQKSNRFDNSRVLGHLQSVDRSDAKLG